MIIFFNQLLAKSILKRTIMLSAAAATADATRQFRLSAYIIRVLEAPAGIRAQVKDLAESATDSIGQSQLVAHLTLFELLSPSERADYIEAYKGVATLASQGPIEVVRDNSWDDGHIPPRQEP